MNRSGSGSQSTRLRCSITRRARTIDSGGHEYGNWAPCTLLAQRVSRKLVDSVWVPLPDRCGRSDSVDGYLRFLKQRSAGARVGRAILLSLALTLSQVLHPSFRSPRGRPQPRAHVSSATGCGAPIGYATSTAAAKSFAAPKPGAAPAAGAHRESP